METRTTHLRRGLWLSALSVAWNGAAGFCGHLCGNGERQPVLLGFGVDAVIDSIASVALIWRFVIRVPPTRACRPSRTHGGSAWSADPDRPGGVSLGWLGWLLAAHAQPEPSSASLALLLASVVVLHHWRSPSIKVAAQLDSGALRSGRHPDRSGPQSSPPSAWRVSPPPTCWGSGGPTPSRRWSSAPSSSAKAGRACGWPARRTERRLQVAGRRQ